MKLNTLMINSPNNWKRTNSSNQAYKKMEMLCRNLKTHWRKWCQLDLNIQRPPKIVQFSIRFLLKNPLQIIFHKINVNWIIIVQLNSRAYLKQAIIVMPMKWWIVQYRKFHRYFLWVPWMDTSQGATVQLLSKESRQVILWHFRTAIGDQQAL